MRDDTIPSGGRHGQNAQGFTLLELTVVVLLLTILLGFVIPAIRGDILRGSQATVARKLSWTVQSLKLKALTEQTRCMLHLDITQGRVWITTDTQPDQAGNHQPINPWTLPEDVRIDGVLFPRLEDLRSGVAAIGFYPQGYSDRAVICLAAESGERMHILVESFLPFARIHDHAGGTIIEAGG